MRLVLICLFAFLGAQRCFAESDVELIALVDLKFLRETDETAVVLCLDDAGEECDVWARHYLWRATIRRVYAGVESERHFLVLYGHHALKKKNLRGVTAVFKKLEPGAPFGARYQITNRGLPQKLLCFENAIPGKTSQTLDVPGAITQHCVTSEAELK